jgi:hypothetical protein
MMASMGQGAGSRGGHVVGFTSGGKPIYGAHADRQHAMNQAALQGHSHLPGQASSAPKGKEKTVAMGDALSRRYRVNKGGGKAARGINHLSVALDRRAQREDRG